MVGSTAAVEFARELWSTRLAGGWRQFRSYREYVHRDRGTSYGEQWSRSRRRKTRRGCHGGETATIDGEKESDSTVRRRGHAAPRTAREKNEEWGGKWIAEAGDERT